MKSKDPSRHLIMGESSGDQIGLDESNSISDLGEEETNIVLDGADLDQIHDTIDRKPTKRPLVYSISGEPKMGSFREISIPEYGQFDSSVSFSSPAEPKQNKSRWIQTSASTAPIETNPSITVRGSRVTILDEQSENQSKLFNGELTRSGSNLLSPLTQSHLAALQAQQQQQMIILLFMAFTIFMIVGMIIYKWFHRRRNLFSKPNLSRRKTTSHYHPSFSWLFGQPSYSRRTNNYRQSAALDTQADLDTKLADICAIKGRSDGEIVHLLERRPPAVTRYQEDSDSIIVEQQGEPTRVEHSKTSIVMLKRKIAKSALVMSAKPKVQRATNKLRKFIDQEAADMQSGTVHMPERCSSLLNRLFGAPESSRKTDEDVDVKAAAQLVDPDDPANQLDAQNTTSDPEMISEKRALVCPLKPPEDSCKLSPSPAGVADGCSSVSVCSLLSESPVGDRGQAELRGNCQRAVVTQAGYNQGADRSTESCIDRTSLYVDYLQPAQRSCCSASPSAMRQAMPLLVPRVKGCYATTSQLMTQTFGQDRSASATETSQPDLPSNCQNFSGHILTSQEVGPENDAPAILAAQASATGLNSLSCEGQVLQHLPGALSTTVPIPEPCYNQARWRPRANRLRPAGLRSSPIELRGRHPCSLSHTQPRRMSIAGDRVGLGQANLSAPQNSPLHGGSAGEGSPALYHRASIASADQGKSLRHSGATSSPRPSNGSLFEQTLCTRAESGLAFNQSGWSYNGSSGGSSSGLGFSNSACTNTPTGMFGQLGRADLPRTIQRPPSLIELGCACHGTELMYPQYRINRVPVYQLHEPSHPERVAYAATSTTNRKFSLPVHLESQVAERASSARTSLLFGENLEPVESNTSVSSLDAPRRSTTEGLSWEPTINPCQQLTHETCGPSDDRSNYESRRSLQTILRQSSFWLDDDDSSINSVMDTSQKITGENQAHLEAYPGLPSQSSKPISGDSDIMARIEDVTSAHDQGPSTSLPGRDRRMDPLRVTPRRGRLSSSSTASSAASSPSPDLSKPSERIMARHSTSSSISKRNFLSKLRSRKQSRPNSKLSKLSSASTTAQVARDFGLDLTNFTANYEGNSETCVTRGSHETTHPPIERSTGHDTDSASLERQCRELWKLRATLHDEPGAVDDWASYHQPLNRRYDSGYKSIENQMSSSIEGSCYQSFRNESPVEPPTPNVVDRLSMPGASRPRSECSGVLNRSEELERKTGSVDEPSWPPRHLETPPIDVALANQCEHKLT